MTVGIIAHGAGSNANVARALLPAESLCCDDVIYLEERSGEIEAVIASIASVAGPLLDAGQDVVVGGISLGAHAAAAWAAISGALTGPLPVRLVLALPAWTGAPDAVAAATRSSAARIRAVGIDSVLHDLQTLAQAGQASPVVAELVRRSWASYDDEALAQALEGAAASPAPDVAALRAIRAATVVITWPGDPLHPESVGRRWAQEIPGAIWTQVTWSEMAVDIGAFARSVARAVALG